MSNEIVKEQGNSHKHRSLCASECVRVFGVPLKGRYLMNVEDCVRAIRTRYCVRSRRSSFPKKATVSQLPNLLNGSKEQRCFYLVSVKGHVLVCNEYGRVLIDTAPNHTKKHPAIKTIHIVKGYQK